MKNMTRRSFLKTAALSAAGMTALSMGAAAAENAEKPAYLPEKWDYEADVVVCGYGVVGAMAAREAIAQGASCLVLEKASEALSGGAGISSAGAVFPNNPLAMHAESRGYVSMDTIMAIDAEGNRVFNWLMCNGLDMSGFGRTVYLSTRAAADKCGTNVLYETPAKRLVFDPVTKEVFGVIAEQAGKEIYVKANKGVLLATGCFLGNEELMHRFLIPKEVHMVNIGAPTCTGDGLMMGMEVGAALKNMTWQCLENYGQGAVAMKKASDELGLGMLHLPAGDGRNARIYVNQQGKRFMDEDQMFLHYKGNNPTLQYNGEWFAYQGFANLPMYLIFDSRLMDEGCIGPNNAMLGYANAAGLYNWSADNKVELEKGWIVKGDTIEELVAKLAEQSGHDPIDAETLKATIETYNGYCAEGNDKEFGRGVFQHYVAPSGLEGLTKPPYYACELTPSAIYTIGGLHWGENGATLDWAGNAIPGLYHAGDVGQFCEVSPVGLRDNMAVGSYTCRNICQNASRVIPGEAAAVIPAPTAAQMAAADISAFDVMPEMGPASDEVQAAIAAANGNYTAGTYTATAKGRNGDVTVSVDFSETAMTAIRVDAHSETEGIGDNAMNALTKTMLIAQSAEVDTVAGATMSSAAFKEAVANCIAQAAK